MRVCIVLMYANSKTKLEKIAKGLSEGLSSQGHQVTIIDAALESDKKLSMYDYVAVGTESISFFGGKIPQKLSQYLSQSGSISGKKAFAFISNTGLRKGKTLSLLMKVMESEGMFLKYSEVLSTYEESKTLGKKLHID